MTPPPDKFLMVPKPLAARRDLRPVDKMLLADMRDRMGRNGKCWPGGRKLATDLGVSRPTILDSLDRLAERGLLEIEHRGNGRGNHYRPRPETGQEPLPVADPSSDPKRSRTLTGGGQEPLPEAVKNLDPNTDIPIELDQEAAAPPAPGRSEPPEKPKGKGKAKARAELPPIPPDLDTPEFRGAWEDWQTHRREIKRALTPCTAGRQLAKLAGWGVEQAIASIEQSIEHGWQGLFAPKGDGQAKAPAAEFALPPDREPTAEDMDAIYGKGNWVDGPMQGAEGQT